jgi:hypothetical protein
VDYERARKAAIRAEVIGGLLMGLVSLVLGLTRVAPLPGRVDLVLALFFAAGAVACFLGALWTLYLPRPTTTRK